jgi:DNA helicase HerA-like ATPase
LLGFSEYREEKKEIRIKREDRRRHLYIIGQTGTGKSSFLSNLIEQDVLSKEGVGILDPHGDLIEDILGKIPKERIEDVVIFDPASAKRAVGLNMLEYDPRFPEQKTFIINELISIFDKLYDLRQTGGPCSNNILVML